MNKPLLVLFLILLLLGASRVTKGRAAEGMVNVKSAHSVAATVERLQNLLEDKGMTVFIAIDHAAGAEHAGLTLRPTSIVVFGNPRVGTPLMRCQQTVALDLPQKALIWEDARGQVWLSYNDPDYLAKRHGVQGCGEVLKKISTALGNFARGATAP